MVSGRATFEGVTCFGVVGANLKEEVTDAEILRAAPVLSPGRSFPPALVEPKTPLSFTPDSMWELVGTRRARFGVVGDSTQSSSLSDSAVDGDDTGCCPLAA